MTESQPTTQPKPQRSSNVNFILTAIVFTALGAMLAVLFLGEADDGLNRSDVEQIVQNAIGTQSGASAPASTAVPPTATRVAIADAVDDDAFLGPDDAPVVMVEFSDYQCPYCGRFYRETLPQILEKYPEEVKFVYRDFPIFGEESARAAMATECAEEQDAFWEMHDKIFDSRDASDAAPLSQETLVSYATELELDASAFEECLANERFIDEVVNDYQAAAGYGFTGTPAFLINGVHVSGAQPFAVFDQVIQDELARAE